MNPSKRQLSRYGWRPADPPRRPVLFINPRSGDGKAARAGVAERARPGHPRVTACLMIGETTGDADCLTYLRHRRLPCDS
jgi:hypothetical protein